MSVKNNPFLKNMDDEVQYCASCGKDVWGSDKVLALGKVWHKGCLKCTECGMTLSVRMLESYNNKPYCRAHVPNAKLTQVTDSISTKMALNAPRAGGRAQGVNKTARMTFMPGKDYKPPSTVKPHGYNPQAPNVPKAATRVQGVNKTSNMAFERGAKADSATAAGPGAAPGDSVEQDYGYGGNYPEEPVARPKPQDAAPSYSAPTPAEDEYGYGGGGGEEYAEETYEQTYEEPAAAEPAYEEPAAEEYAEGGADEGGYYDEAGNWVDTSGAAGGDEGGYYDEAGNWIDTAGGDAAGGEADAGEGGYYDEEGNWVDTSGGYYDEEGNWVDTSGGGEGGYYDDAGNWIEG